MFNVEDKVEIPEWVNRLSESERIDRGYCSYGGGKIQRNWIKDSDVAGAAKLFGIIIGGVGVLVSFAAFFVKLPTFYWVGAAALAVGALTVFAAERKVWEPDDRVYAWTDLGIARALAKAQTVRATAQQLALELDGHSKGYTFTSGFSLGPWEPDDELQPTDYEKYRPFEDGLAAFRCALTGPTTAVTVRTRRYEIISPTWDKESLFWPLAELLGEGNERLRSVEKMI